MSERKDKQTESFSDIALSLSGGGYRAAAFHLGTMAYLDRVGLLKNVTAISTVSGGTFTGALYALCLSRGETFRHCYDHLFKQFEEVDLVEEGLELLSKGRSADNIGSHNLINCMADIYHRKFFGEATFAEILNAKDSHLKEVKFNCTEFQFGLPFRFQAVQSPKAFIGNKQVSIARDVAEEIRLADIVAASSCFPGGFEPLDFPTDFIHENQPKLKKLREQREFAAGVGMMDGGIVDNQGIGSILNSIERTKQYPDLFIISDVSTRYMKPFEFPVKSITTNRGIGIGGLNTSLIVAILAVVVAMVLSLVSVTALWEHELWVVLAALAVSFVLLVPALYGLYKVQRILTNDILRMVPRIGNRAWKLLKKISVGRFAEMMKVRANSMLTMVSDVNMKQVRRLIYERVYKNPKFKYSRVSNLIDSLTPERVIERSADKDYEYLPKSVLKPSEKLLDVAEKASKMGTTLWFTDEELKCGRHKDLIASGEFTVCFRLIENTLKRFGSDARSYPEEIRVLNKQLIEDWEAFNKNPWMMME